MHRENGRLALPGGFLNTAERPDIAASRELHEETNIAIGETALKLVEVVYLPDPLTTDNAWLEVVAYGVDLDSKNNIPKASSDAKKSQWMDIEDALKELLPAHQYILRNSQNR